MARDSLTTEVAAMRFHNEDGDTMIVRKDEEYPDMLIFVINESEFAIYKKDVKDFCRILANLAENVNG